MTRDYFHVSEVEPQELMRVLLGHFNNAQSTRELVYKFQKQNSQHSLELACDEVGNIKRISPSSGFPSDELDEIEKKIQETLLTKHGIKIGRLFGFSGEKITGYFRYKDLFQMLPMPDDAPKPEVAIADHPFLIEVPYETCPDITIDQARMRKKAIIYTRLLNLLANQFISLGSRYTRFAWALHRTDESNWTSKWTQLGYIYSGSGLKGTENTFSPVDTLQLIERVPFQTYYSSPLGTSGETLKLPDNLEQSLDTIFALHKDNMRKFFLACSWYAQYRHTWEESHSSAFIALVTALECLAQEKEICPACNQPLLENEEDICQSCGQPRYRVTRHFQAFLRKYFPSIDQFPKEKKTLYQVRSQLAHGMDLLQADLEPWKFFFDARMQEQDALQRNLYYIVGVAIYNWLHMVSIASS